MHGQWAMGREAKGSPAKREPSPGKGLMFRVFLFFFARAAHVCLMYLSAHVTAWMLNRAGSWMTGGCT